MTTSVTLRPLHCMFPVKGMEATADFVAFLIYVPLILVIAFTGVLGNILSYVVLSRETRLSSVSLLLKALAIADGSVLITFTMMFSLPSIHVYTGHFLSYRILSVIINNYLLFAVKFTKTTSVYILMCVSIERYIAICKPLQATSLCTIRNARVALLLALAFAFTYNFPVFWYNGFRYYFDPCSKEMRPRTSYILADNFYFRLIHSNLLYITFLFIVPLVVLVYTTLWLVIALRGTPENDTARMAKTRAKQLVAITKRVVTVVVIFLVLEITPFIMRIIVYLLNYTSIRVAMKKEAYNVIRDSLYLLAAFNSFVNFYVYILTGEKFRKTFLSMFRFKLKEKNVGFS